MHNLIDQARIDRGLWWQEALSLTSGCTRAGAECLNCWAEANTHKRRTSNFYAFLTDDNGRWNGNVTFNHEQLKKLNRRKPTVFAVWNDLFHEKITLEQQKMAFDAFLKHPEHVFVVLTKRVDQMEVFSEWYRTNTGLEKFPPHIIGGTTAGTQKMVDERISVLLGCGFSTTVVSIEPLLFEVGIEPYLEHPDYEDGDKLSWVIIGAESGPNRRKCETEWIKNIVQICDESKTPCLVKQIHDKNSKLIKKFSDFPESVKKREFPVIQQYDQNPLFADMA